MRWNEDAYKNVGQASAATIVLSFIAFLILVLGAAPSAGPSSKPSREDLVEVFQKLPAHVQKALIDGEGARRDRMSELSERTKSGLAEIREIGRRPSAEQRQTINALRKKITQQQAEMDKLGRRDTFYPAEMSYNLNVGDVGLLPGTISRTVEVDDIAGMRESQALNLLEAKERAALRIVSVADGTNVLLGNRSTNQLLLWLTNVTTGGLIDGNVYNSASVFRVSGTRQYESAGGSLKTVPMLEPIDVMSAATPQMLQAAAWILDERARTQGR